MVTTTGKKLGTMLGHPRERARAPGFALGYFEGFQLAVRINPQALHLLETDPSTSSHLGVVTINSPAVLGLRYIDAKAKAQKMLIAQLGKKYLPGVTLTLFADLRHREHLLNKWCNQFTA
jgi:hypothetical protein